MITGNPIVDFLIGFCAILVVFVLSLVIMHVVAMHDYRKRVEKEHINSFFEKIENARRRKHEP